MQGGIGALGDGERFGANFQLPNATAYNETCAAVGNVYWNERMFLLHGDSKYIDLLEKVLYNGLISGFGLDGKSFFYTNAMQIGSVPNKNAEAGRSGWFECSCCPTNLARLLPSIPGYVYAQKDDAVFINLFMSGQADLMIGKKPVQIIQQNNYPWNGLLAFTISPQTPQAFEIKIRIPGWVKNEAIPSDLYSFQNKTNPAVTIKLNGKPVKYTMQNGYAVINKTWQKNDKLTVDLPMPVRKVIANTNVPEDAGKVALQRGPMIYCAEWKDNDGKISNVIIPENAVFTPSFHKELLNGLTVLNGKVLKADTADKNKLVPAMLTAIPYYSWANRGKGEMTVWFPEEPTAVVEEKKK